MPNEFIARNGIVSRGNLVVSGSVTSTSPASFSGSLSVTGSITSTNNIQGNQFSSTVGSVIGGRYFSDVLIAAGTVTYGSYSTTNVANLDIYANNANIGNGALLRLSSRFGGDNGAYLVSSQTGSVVLAVNGTTYLSNQGLVLNGSTMNVGIGITTPTGKLHVVGSGATSSTTALLVQNANASASLEVKDDRSVTVSGILTANSSSIINGPLTVNYGDVVGGTSLYINGNTAHNGGRGITTTGYAYGIQASHTMTGNWVNNPQAAGVYGTGDIGINGQGNIIGVTSNTAFFTSLSSTPRINARVTSSLVQIRGFGSGSATTALLVQNSNASASLAVLDNGNIGIGTATPTASLHISGASSNVLFEIDSPAVNNILFVSGSGAIGLGTSNPTASLQIYGLSNKLYFQSPTTNQGRHDISFGFGGNGEQVKIITSAAGGSGQGLFYIAAASGDSAVATTSDANLAISTTATTLKKIVTIDNNVSGLTYPGLFISGYQPSAVTSGIYFTYSETRVAILSKPHGGSGYADFRIAIVPLGGASSNNPPQESDTKFMITKDTTNVLINTTTDSGGKLTVKGSGTTSSTTSLLVQDSSNNTSFIVQDDRKVGIGKAPTTASLHVFTPGTSPDPKIVAIFEGYVFPAQPEVKIGIGSDGSGADNFGSWFGHNVKPSSEGNFGFVQMYGAGRTLTWNSRGHVAIGTVSGSYSPNIFRIEPKSFDSNTVWDTSGIMFNVQSGSVSVITGNLNNDVAVAGFGTITLNANVIARTYTNASTVYIQGPPRAGTNTAITSSWALYVNSGSNYFRNSIQLATGSLSVNTISTGSALNIYKSGSTVVDIQGSQGQLFSVLDALSGSLMSVNDISGLPILEVFSDDRVVMGTYGAPAVTISGSSTVISGSLRGRVVTLSTASATASMDCSLSNFFDLTLSGSMYLTPTNILPGETINLRITQPATSGSLNYTSSIKFPNGLPYTASATSSVVDLISFISFDSTTLYATAIKNLV